MKNRLFDNTIIYALDTVVIVLASLLATPFLIHGLGVDVYGIYVFLNVFTVYGALLLFDFGLEGSVINHVARADSVSNKKRVREIFSSALLFYGLIALLVSSVFYFFTAEISAGFLSSLPLGENGEKEKVESGIKLMPIIMFTQFLTLSLSSVLEGLSKYHITKGVGVALTLVQYSLVTAVAINTHSLYYVYGCVLLTSIIRLLLLSFFLIFNDKNFYEEKVSFSVSTAKILIEYSGVLFISRIIGFIFNHMDKFLIWRFLSPSAMALYDIIVRPASLLRITVTVINSAVIPEISRYDESGQHEKIKKVFLNFVRFSYILTVPLMLVLTINMSYLLEVWVGQEFSVHYKLTFILLVIYIFNPIPAVASTIFVGMELVRKTIFVSVAGALINLIISFSLVDVIGIKGLLVGTLVAELFMFVPYVFYAKKYIGVSYREVFYTPCKIITLYAPLFLIIWLSLISGPGMFSFLISIGALMFSYIFAFYAILSVDERNILINKVVGWGK